MTAQVNRILVVEDNPGDLRLIREAMRQHAIDCQLIHYETADEAIKAIDSFRADQPDLPHLILLDFNLPRGDARDLLAATSRNPALRGIPTAVVSSSVAPQDRAQAMQLGATTFIIKPSRLDEFLNEVGSTIARLLAGTESKGTSGELNS
jgi:CheY-like chemotaxis protein